MRSCCGQTRNLFCTHSFIKALTPVECYRSQSLKAEPNTDCCWEQSALWSAMVAPPCHLLLQLLLLAAPSPGPAPALVALHREMSSRNTAGRSWSTFWISLTSWPPQDCCLHKGTAGNRAGRGQDSSSEEQQPFLRPAWWDHSNSTPVPQAAVQTFILLGLHMRTHSLNTKSSKTSWKLIFKAKTLGGLKNQFCCQHHVPLATLANVSCIQWAKAIL